MEETRVVRNGYNKMGRRYHDTRDVHKIDDILADFSDRLPLGAKALDAGSGSGVPVARFLSERGLHVTGIDVSPGMVALARELVPAASFVEMDMTALQFEPASFDAVACVFALFHVPRAVHGQVIRSFHRILRPGGYLLLNNGTTASEGYSTFFGERMFWSNWSPAKTLELVSAAGFSIEFGDVLERGGEHQHWIVARVPVPSASK